MSRRPARLVLGLLLVTGVTASVSAAAGLAAGLPVAGQRLTVYRSARCTAPGTQTVTGPADSYVFEGQPTTNYGGAPRLQVQADAAGGRMRSLLKFTLPPIPAGCSVTAARLRLNATSAQAGRTLEVLLAGGPWTEAGVQWVSQPPAVGTAATAASATGWVEWTVTTHVQMQYQTVNEGLVVRDANETTGSAVLQVFRSDEGPNNRPQLVITFG